MKPKLVLACAALVGALATVAQADITVSSKIDTEGGLLGNIIALALEDAGLPVERRLQLGGTQVVREALLAGQIDIYPEYTGNAAFFFNEADSNIWKDAEASRARAAELDAAENDLTWLQSAPANNTWAIAVTGAIATENNLVTMSDFGAWVTGGGEVKLAASTEFVSSPAVLPAMQQAYGFVLSPDQTIVLSGGDTAATIQAAARGTSGVNAAMAYGTDGGVGATGLVVMVDDLGVQPVYEPTPVVRAAVLAEYPAIAEVLNPIFAGLDMATLQSLNGRIQVGGEPAGAVARDYLTATGVLD
ncbi:Putative osmoprotectant uptake system substrate-binding protein OsmF precursor [Thalassovita gelatinovora]|uniref:Putative osmoprotectant uptake system substrate-binding protein OsmF n=1 Tax=Thalassovita gelatinovora TaxID=53501 RepID=A0A0P1F735_THAGE|nr:ABC transporter substrate-binding protein [Thalassovita gelatinovora]QIZ80898.1 ABC transporter substrate-binding protein [Thalassovita gelatinovora]CUH63377.1 Putative osmoprotectant uptake system substrate-binding protein OsmF precursor [Thalassovita gelatinovora]SEQ66027.1 osmoprotectant transport system substrate-binding protein [Thalassovita gelatinovora]